MISLFIAIVCASIMYLLFKQFRNVDVPIMPALVVNYLMASVLSMIVAGDTIWRYLADSSSDYLYITIGLGLCFITILRLLGITTQLLGVAASTTISRMSLVIPTAFSVLLYKDSFSWMKGVGVMLALAAIYFVVDRPQKGPESDSKRTLKFMVPAAAFLGQGLLDTFFKAVKVNYFNAQTPPTTFYACIYSFALCIGLIILIADRKNIFALRQPKTWLWGGILGIFNFLALYFFFLALKLPGSVVFPVNSVGVVLVSTLLSIILFKERLKPRNWLGMALAVAAILFIALGK